LQRAPAALPCLGIEVLGALPEPVVATLEIGSPVRSVFMHAATVEHVRGGRGDDAAFVLAYAAHAIHRPHYVGRDPRHSNRFDLVHAVEEQERALLVAVKLVTAVASRSGLDELWVSTAYPLPRNFLLRKRWRDSLIPSPAAGPSASPAGLTLGIEPLSLPPGEIDR
jgi:hypothetical protein